MPRPTCCRRVAGPPKCGLFKPAGVPCSSLEEIVLMVDEMEAMRLADLEGMYQEQAAGQMNISRQTFGRVIESARRKVAQALCQGQALRIEGGTVEVVTMRKFQCHACQHVWELPHGTGRPQECAKCASANIHRAVEERGCAGGGRGRCHRHGAGGGVGRNGSVAAQNKPGKAGEGESA